MKIKTVYIEITNRCNLNCRTCYNRSGLNRETREISVAEIEQIMQTLSRYGANRFLFSGGEPSLHSHFHELLEMTERYGQYSFGFVTNGTNLDRTWIDYLNTHDNVTLQISLDGANEAQNRLTRGDGNFAKAIAFAKEIQNPSLKPLLKMVISQQNMDGVADFYTLALSLGFTPEFAFIYKSGNGSDEWESKKLSAQEKIKVLKLIDSLNREHHIDAFLPKCTVKCPFVTHTDALSVCIKTDGSMQPCQSLYSSEFTLGNLFAFEEDAVLQRVEALFALAEERAKTDFGCGKCLLGSVCGRGCMAEAFMLSQDPLGNDQACTYRKLQFLDFEIKKQQEVRQKQPANFPL